MADFSTSATKISSANPLQELFTETVGNFTVNVTEFPTEYFTESYTGNLTEQLTEAPKDDITARVMNITLMTVGIATVLMNIFVITIILAYKWMRSNANLIIGSMAITDLLAGVVTITAGVVKWTDWFSVQGGAFCKIFYTIDGWAAMASLAHVLVRQQQ